MAPAATRNSWASSRFVPVSSRTSLEAPPARAASGSAGRTSPSTVGLNGSRLRASWPHRAGSGAVWTSSVSAPAACETRSAGWPAMASRLAGTPRASARYWATRRLSSGASVCAPAPLWVIACWNSPLATGMASRVVMLMAPADSPATVTRPGSPPNAAMFSRTHRSAATWSSSPTLATPSPV